MEVGISRAKVTGIAPQFLVDDLPRSIEYYCECLGFELDFSYESFYASVSRDGCAIHLKAAAKTVADRLHRRQHEHLDAYIALTDAAALHEELRSRGARITKPLEERPWSCKDFYVEDPDGYILCFSEQTAESPQRVPHAMSCDARVPLMSADSSQTGASGTTTNR